MEAEKKTNKLVIINGSTRGLGLALVSELLKINKFDIICLVRNEKSLSGLLEFKDKVLIRECDFNNIESVSKIDSFFEKTLYNYKGEVYYINNLSIVTPIGRIGTLKNEDILQNLTINFSSNLIIINSFLKHVKISSNINILNISSGISQNPVAGIGLYGMAKNFIDYLTKTIKKENNEINVASFYPGGMNTKMQEDLQKEITENVGLKEFDYSNIFNQKLYETEYIAKIIITNFLLKKAGWEKLISKIYEYQE
ncbi:SDR family NAD(P)-dependent oxidoreductase [uncultured Flavobacterium sp.]|uniref:SDR family NAD(P)-dependent oxidoreductase n=1 Tax=uncultured Flavobacterium sp. TaxID=165435 RepID=UPI0030EE47F6|tara:strand:- start:77070 stop:77831 length:762 start_codon:yes stop_codon:yes gene_type:complete